MSGPNPKKNFENPLHNLEKQSISSVEALRKLKEEVKLPLIKQSYNKKDVMLFLAERNIDDPEKFDQEFKPDLLLDYMESRKTKFPGVGVDLLALKPLIKTFPQYLALTPEAFAKQLKAVGLHGEQLKQTVQAYQVYRLRVQYLRRIVAISGKFKASVKKLEKNTGNTFLENGTDWMKGFLAKARENFDANPEVISAVAIGTLVAGYLLYRYSKDDGWVKKGFNVFGGFLGGTAKVLLGAGAAYGLTTLGSRMFTGKALDTHISTWMRKEFHDPKNAVGKMLCQKNADYCSRKKASELDKILRTLTFIGDGNNIEEIYAAYQKAKRDGRNSLEFKQLLTDVQLSGTDAFLAIKELDSIFGLAYLKNKFRGMTLVGAVGAALIEDKKVLAVFGSPGEKNQANDEYGDLLYTLIPESLGKEYPNAIYVDNIRLRFGLVNANDAKFTTLLGELSKYAKKNFIPKDELIKLVAAGPGVDKPYANSFGSFNFQKIRQKICASGNLCGQNLLSSAARFDAADNQYPQLSGEIKSKWRAILGSRILLAANEDKKALRYLNDLWKEMRINKAPVNMVLNRLSKSNFQQYYDAVLKNINSINNPALAEALAEGNNINYTEIVTRFYAKDGVLNSYFELEQQRDGSFKLKSREQKLSSLKIPKAIQNHQFPLSLPNKNGDLKSFKESVSIFDYLKYMKLAIKILDDTAKYSIEDKFKSHPFYLDEGKVCFARKGEWLTVSLMNFFGADFGIDESNIKPKLLCAILNELYKKTT